MVASSSANRIHGLRDSFQVGRVAAAAMGAGDVLALSIVVAFVIHDQA